ncbi:GNAT family N-acetyltransferase [Pseudoneobacillus sp. C159]
MLFRQAMLEDAFQFAELIHQVENSSNYMLFNPGERKKDPEARRKMLQAFQDKSNSAIFVCEDVEELIGYLIADGGFAEKNKHSAYLVVGISPGYRGRGIGKRLFEELFKWADQQQIHRLELTVVSENHQALALYKKMGFQIEGTKRDSLKINDKYVNEYYMSKLL